MIRPRLGCVLAAVVFALTPFHAISLPPASLRIEPAAIVPVGNYSNPSIDGSIYELYSLGYGLNLNADLSFLGHLSPFLETGVNAVPLNGLAGSRLLFAQGGGGLSGYMYPVSRLMLRAGASGGLAYASVPVSGLNQALSGMALYWKAQAEVGYRFSPGLSILGTAAYSQLLGAGSTLFKGISAGLVFNIGLDRLGSSASGLVTGLGRQQTIFPITYYKSDRTPIAYLELLNEEQAEIRDVRVSFSAGSYTSRSADCGQFKVILQNGRVETPIYANFNDRVLGFSETTKIPGEIRVDYKLLDSARSSTKSITVVFNNRNAATWEDERVAAAFISPQDPVMLELSKYLAGLVRVHARAEIDPYLQYGMGLFEGLRVYGLTWTEDPHLPYSIARKDNAKVAYLQYPYQTLSYKSGDSDALAFVMAEALESVAVPAAIAALPEDVIVAFPLKMDVDEARLTFSSLRDFIFESGVAWVPLRASMIRDGFLRAWQAGAELWRSQPKDSTARLIKIEEAWKDYSPIALADVDFRPVKPAEEAVVLAFENTLGRFVGAEVEPKLQRLLAEMGDSPTGRDLNNLGVVYAQYGMYDEANAQFAKSVATGYSPALVNLANIAFALKEYEIAAAYFEQAIKAQPENKVALLGLARSRYELDNIAEASELFTKVKSIDPSLAERYSYLSARVESASPVRASSPASERAAGVTWDRE